jgi:hypothetical protein
MLGHDEHGDRDFRKAPPPRGNRRPAQWSRAAGAPLQRGEALTHDSRPQRQGDHRAQSWSPTVNVTCDGGLQGPSRYLGR